MNRIEHHAHVHVIRQEDALDKAHALGIFQLLKHWEHWEQLIANTLEQFSRQISSSEDQCNIIAQSSTIDSQRLFKALSLLRHSPLHKPMIVQAYAGLSQFNLQVAVPELLELLQEETNVTKEQPSYLSILLNTLKNCCAHDPEEMKTILKHAKAEVTLMMMLQKFPDAKTNTIVHILSFIRQENKTTGKSQPEQIEEKQDISKIGKESAVNNTATSRSRFSRKIERFQEMSHRNTKSTNDDNQEHEKVESDELNEVMYLFQSKSKECQMYALKKIQSHAHSMESWSSFTENRNIIPELLHYCFNNIDIIVDPDQESSKTQLLVQRIIEVIAKICQFQKVSSSTKSSLDTMLLIPDYASIIAVVNEALLLSKKNTPTNASTNTYLGHLRTIIEHFVDNNPTHIEWTVDVTWWIKLLLIDSMQCTAARALEKSTITTTSSTNLSQVMKYCRVIFDVMHTEDETLLNPLLNLLVRLNSIEKYKPKLIELGIIPIAVKLLGVKETARYLSIQRMSAKILANIARSRSVRSCLLLHCFR